MRNFGSMKIEFAEVDARAARLGVARGDFAHVVPVRSGGQPSAANANLVYFAGLALTGYSDTSANLPR